MTWGFPGSGRESVPAMWQHRPARLPAPRLAKPRSPALANKKGALRGAPFTCHVTAYFSSNAFSRFTNAAGSAICAPSASRAWSSSRRAH